MRRVLMAMFVALIVFSSGCKKAEKNVVITVNDTPIMQKEVDVAVEKQMNSPFLAQFDKKSDEAKLLMLISKDRAINELIVKKIIENEIVKRNLTVSDEEINKQKDAMLADIGGEENLKKVLEAQNISENEFKTMLADQIQINKLVGTLAPISVKDSDVRKFYNENKASKFTYPDVVKASHILIKDEAKAKEVLAKAKVPNADFSALAKQYSEDTGSAVNGGDLGFFSKEQMVKPFSDAAFSLKPDDISDLVKSEFGYHIIKVTDRKRAGVTPFDEVKNEIKKYLEDEQKVKVLQDFINGQKNLTKVVYVDENYNPETIRKQVQEFSNNQNIAPQPSSHPPVEKGE